MYSYFSALRHDRWIGDAPPPPLHEERPADLLSMRLLLTQHLEELRLRGVSETVLHPIEEELRRYGQTIDELVHLSQP